MAKEMLINRVEGQECRIAIISDGALMELYVERVSSASHVGNIYKGRVTNVEPAIQAAFVDFGLNRNGFLHISDVTPQYYGKGKKPTEPVGKKHPRKTRPPVQDCIRRGQEVVVQMTKEGIGTKGPTLTTYLSIPGKLLVMMPGMTRLGVSRKIEDENARSAARNLLADLPLPNDMGFIVRTAGITSSKRELRRDLNYLLRLWKAVENRIKTSKAPAEIYQESDLVTRTIRDIYNTDIKRVICDSEAVARKVKEFLDVAMPRTKHVIELYTGKEGLFHEYGLESEIEKVYSPKVPLPSGGSLLIDQTEALVAIDVNSGRFREHSDAESTALKIDLEAAKEIARQLPLRDMGGVIVIDFIDLREMNNRRAVEKAFRTAMKPDRAKTKILKMSSFCILEMTRQRVRPSLKDSIYARCRSCGGTGLVKSEESLALHIMRNLQRASNNEDVAEILVKVSPSVGHHLLNYQRQRITEIERAAHRKIIIHTDPELTTDDVRITCTNHRGSAVAWDRQPASSGAQRVLETINIDEMPRSGDREPKAKPPTAPEADTTKAETKKTHRNRRRKKPQSAPTKDSGESTSAAPTQPPTKPHKYRRRRKKASAQTEGKQ